MPLIWTGAIVLGLAALVRGSDRFVPGASVTARNLGVPPLLAGLTVFGVGTSAPEIPIATAAARADQPAGGRRAAGGVRRLPGNVSVFRPDLTP